MRRFRRYGKGLNDISAVIGPVSRSARRPLSQPSRYETHDSPYTGPGLWRRTKTDRRGNKITFVGSTDPGVREHVTYINGLPHHRTFENYAQGDSRRHRRVA